MLVPVGDGHLGAVALGHLGGLGLDLVPAIEAPDDQPHARRSGIAQGSSAARCRRSWGGFDQFFSQLVAATLHPADCVIAQLLRLSFDAIQLFINPGVGAEGLRR
jgi:hypothetical protein